MVERTLFVEGGGDGKALRSECRKGFRKLLERAGCEKRMPRIVACGGRTRAFAQFEAALRVPRVSAILLIDAEAPLECSDPWDHVRRRPGDCWQRPASATTEQLHFMVQLMETWLLADRPGLTDFFGAGFRDGALPANPRVEEIPKRDVMSGLCEASRGSRKGEYHKGTHSFVLLGRVDPARLSAVSPWARRFFEHMRREA